MTECKVPNLFKGSSLKEEVLIVIVLKVVSRLRASACPHRSPKRLSSPVKPRQRGRGVGGGDKSKNEEDRGRARRDRDCLTY